MKRHIFVVVAVVVAMTITGCSGGKEAEPTTQHMHKYRKTVVRTASCETEGECLYQCEDTACGHSYTELLPKLSHIYTQWSETKAPSCTEKGEQCRTCENCDLLETREIAMLPHNIVHHNVRAATCTAVGWNAYDSCSNCNYTTYAELPAHGHNYGSWQVVNNPTTTTEGKMTAVCQADSAHVGMFTLPKLSTTNGYTYQVVTPATETKSGTGRYTYNKDGVLFHFDVEIARNETEFDPR